MAGSVYMFDDALTKMIEIQDFIESTDMEYSKSVMRDLPPSEREAFKTLVAVCRDFSNTWSDYFDGLDDSNDEDNESDEDFEFDGDNNND